MTARHLIISLNLVAVSGLMIVELFRPGFVTGAVNLGWVWFGTAALLVAGYRLTERSG
jgi:hypothetical protein